MYWRAGVHPGGVGEGGGLVAHHSSEDSDQEGEEVEEEDLLLFFDFFLLLLILCLIKENLFSPLPYLVVQREGLVSPKVALPWNHFLRQLAPLP